MKRQRNPLAALLAVVALAVAAPAAAQRDGYYGDRYSDERYDDERFEEDRYGRERYEDERYEVERYEDDGRERFAFAQVLAVDPIVDIASRPVEREECRQEPVARRERARSAAPAITPGIIGAVLGQPSTTGRNGTAATVGASSQHAALTRRCTRHTEYVREERITGYDVTYRYRGRDYQAVTQRDPGDRVRIKVNY